MTHVLACGSQYFWCSDEHANGWALLILAGAAAGFVIAVLLAAIVAGFRR